MKKLFLAILAVFSISHLHAQQSPQQWDQTNTIFLWDLHDVVLKRDKGKTAKALTKLLFGTNILVNKKTRSIIGKLAKDYTVAEANAETLIRAAHDFPKIVSGVIEMGNAYKPLRGTVAIMKELKDAGYTHHIGSNIAQTLFTHISDPENNPLLASTFSLFDLEKSHVVCWENGKPLPRKPEIAFFTNYLQDKKIDLSKTRVIFIDDKIKNIEAARKAGLIGIHFTSPKKLRKDLHDLGISTT